MLIVLTSLLIVCILSASIFIVYYAYYNEKPVYINKHDVVSRIMCKGSNGEKMANNYIRTINKFCKKLNKDDLDDKFKNVYIIPDVFSKDECDWIIYESEQYAQHNGWTKKRHESYPTTDNKINAIENIYYYLQNKIHRNIIPHVENQYNIKTNLLGLDEAFVVKYSCKSQSFLEKHRDHDDFSFVVVLNDDYDGGGTYFYDINEKVKASLGSVIIFCGRMEHTGIEIESGHRYIIAGFLSCGKDKYCADVNSDQTTKQKFNSYYK